MATTAKEARMRLGPQTAFALETGKRTETFIDMTLCNGLANSAFTFRIPINSSNKMSCQVSDGNRSQILAVAKVLLSNTMYRKVQGLWPLSPRKPAVSETMFHYDVQLSEWNNI